MYPFISIGRFQLSLYGLCMATGILIAGFLACRRAARRGGEDTMVLALAAAGVGLGLLGAYVTYFIVSYPGGVPALFQEMRAGDFHGLGEGGLVFYGGLIPAAAGVLLMARLLHLDLGLYLDAMVPCVPLGHAFGRLGCTFAGCCYGIDYTGVGALHTAYAPEHTHFPVQPLEAALNVLLFLALARFTKNRRRGMKTLWAYLAGYGVIRFGLEFLRGDLIRGVYGTFSTSQWISLALVALAAGAMICSAMRKTASNKEGAGR